MPKVSAKVILLSQVLNEALTRHVVKAQLTRHVVKAQLTRHVVKAQLTRHVVKAQLTRHTHTHTHSRMHSGKHQQTRHTRTQLPAGAIVANLASSVHALYALGILCLHATRRLSCQAFTFPPISLPLHSWLIPDTF